MRARVRKCLCVCVCACYAGACACVDCMPAVVALRPDDACAPAMCAVARAEAMRAGVSIGAACVKMLARALSCSHDLLRATSTPRSCAAQAAPRGCRARLCARMMLEAAPLAAPTPSADPDSAELAKPAAGDAAAQAPAARPPAGDGGAALEVAATAGAGAPTAKRRRTARPRRGNDLM